jgi:hypothetical protein
MLRTYGMPGQLIALALMVLAVSALVGVGALDAGVSVTAAVLGDGWAGVQVGLTQTLFSVTEFDFRLVGCPTIVIQEH